MAPRHTRATRPDRHRRRCPAQQLCRGPRREFSAYDYSVATNSPGTTNAIVSAYELFLLGGHRPILRVPVFHESGDGRLGNERDPGAFRPLRDHLPAADTGFDQYSAPGVLPDPAGALRPIRDASAVETLRLGIRNGVRMPKPRQCHLQACQNHLGVASTDPGLPRGNDPHASLGHADAGSVIGHLKGSRPTGAGNTNAWPADRRLDSL